MEQLFGSWDFFLGMLAMPGTVSEEREAKQKSRLFQSLLCCREGKQNESFASFCSGSTTLGVGVSVVCGGAGAPKSLSVSGVWRQSGIVTLELW